jgi:hypothetical protein
VRPNGLGPVELSGLCLNGSFECCFRILHFLDQLVLKDVNGFMYSEPNQLKTLLAQAEDSVSVISLHPATGDRAR